MYISRPQTAPALENTLTLYEEGSMIRFILLTHLITL